MTYEYIVVTYGWNTSKYEWHTITYDGHTNDIRMAYEWHANDIRNIKLYKGFGTFRLYFSTLYVVERLLRWLQIIFGHDVLVKFRKQLSVCLTKFILLVLLC